MQTGRSADLHWIVDINELMYDAKSLCNMRAQGLHAVTLGRMMAGGNVGNAGLTCQMHGRLRNLAADIDPSTGSDGVPEITLGTAGTPGDRLQGLCGIADEQ